MARSMPDRPTPQEQVEMAMDYAADQAAMAHPDTQALKETLKGQMLAEAREKPDMNTKARVSNWSCKMGQSYGPQGAK